MKGTIIILDIIILIIALVGFIQESISPVSDSVISMIFLMTICICNIYVLIVNKKDWSDNFLKNKFFKRKKLLKIVAIFTALILILPIPFYSNRFWLSVKAPFHFRYSSNWTGIYKFTDTDTFHKGEYINNIKMDLKTKEECIKWGESQHAMINDEKGYYECGKNCIYNRMRLNRGFCLSR